MKTFTNFLLIFLMIGISITATAQTTRYVTANGTGAGTSWADASGDLQAMINASTSGDKIFVAKGTYIPNTYPRTTDTGNTLITSSIEKNYTFHLKDGVKLYGGFAGTETTENDRTDIRTTNETILSGDALNDDILVHQSGIPYSINSSSTDDNRRHVIVSINDSDNTVLDGFSITGGVATSISTPGEALVTIEGTDIRTARGGGIYLHKSATTITNCYFYENHAGFRFGAGMYIDGDDNPALASPIITNCSFENNFANSGGAVYVSSAQPTFNQCKMEHNIGYLGGAIHSKDASLKVYNSLFYENLTNVNVSSGNGGAIDHSGTTQTTIGNCTFVGNKAGADGGAILASYSTNTLNIYNSIFWDNRAKDDTDNQVKANVAGADVEVGATTPTVTIFNSFVQENSSLINTTNNVSFTDPIFEIYSSSPTTIHSSSAYDLQLQVTSAAINAGDNANYDATMGNEDLAGNERIFKTTIDIGAYENQFPDISPSADNVVYVSKNGTAQGNGSSWANANSSLSIVLKWASIQPTNVTNGLKVFIAKGTYKPEFKSGGTTEQDKTFILTNGMELYGGFAGTESSQNDRSSIHTNNKTVLSGDFNDDDQIIPLSSNRFSILQNDENAKLVLSAQENSIIDGLSITGGNKTGSDIGGGIKAADNVTLNNLRVYQNSTNTGGSGAAMGLNSTVTNSIFSYNSCEGSTSGGWGAGLSVTHNSSVVNCVFYKNITFGKGGGLYTYGENITVLNSTFYQNAAFVSSGSNDLGGAIYATDAATNTGGFSGGTSIYNNIFYDNTTVGQNNIAGADITFVSLSSSTITVTHCLTQENSSYSTGTGIINNQNPLFADADNGNFRLKCESLAINAGTNTSVPLPATDINGNTRLFHNHIVDMGAYESRLLANIPLENNVVLTKVPLTSGFYESDRVIIDGPWKHYCTCDNLVLLSLSSNSNVPDYGVSLKIGTESVSYYPNNTGFITNPAGAVLLNRTWNATPTTQPSSDVSVRYYYRTEEYDNLNTELSSRGMTTLSANSDMDFYKATAAGSHLSVADISENDMIAINHGTTSSTTEYISGLLDGYPFAEFKVSNFSGGGGGSVFASSLLPVELVAFTGEQEEKAVKLNWRTASELNNSHFEIEHSTNNTDWYRIGQVAGYGNSTIPQSYEYLHANPTLGMNYYRLKQVDLDGTSEYSSIISVRFGDRNKVEIYPNPTTEQLYFNNTVSFEIYDLLGNKVLSGTSNSTSVSSLQAGIYFIYINNTIHRFVKM